MAATTLAPQDITKAFAPLEGLVAPRGDGRMSEMQFAWHYLQVYAAWGLRLPSTESDFKLVLQTQQPGRYSFFDALVDGASALKGACKAFLSDTLPDIIAVGNDLHRFAENASNESGEMFSIIIDLLEGSKPDPQAALDLLSDLKKDASKALARAESAQKGLGTFKTAITDAAGTIARAKQTIDADNDVNDATIVKLSSTDPAIKDSLANLTKLRNEAKDEYDNDVVVASTTVTYAWVGFPLLPVGLISAVVVAGIFGDKAVKKLAEVDGLDAKIKTANEQLSRAVAVQGTYHLAAAAVSSVTKYTEKAILQATTVKNGWQDVLLQLGDVGTQIGRTLNDDGSQESLRSTKLVKTFLVKTEEKWRELVPYLEALTTAPYIRVSPNAVTIAEFANEVKAELAKAA